MAYNFKNALVNLNEEIRKNNSGGDLPAVKLAVSQLQVSMAAVKSSVASVSEEVQRIKSDLQSLSSYSETPQKIGTWLDGRSVYRAIHIFDPLITITTDWSNLFAAVNNEDIILRATAYRGDHNAICNFEAQVYQGNVQGSTNTGTYANVNMVLYEYVEAASSNQKKKGGKK